MPPVWAEVCCLPIFVQARHYTLDKDAVSEDPGPGFYLSPATAELVLLFTCDKVVTISETVYIVCAFHGPSLGPTTDQSL